MFARLFSHAFVEVLVEVLVDVLVEVEEVEEVGDVVGETVGEEVALEVDKGLAARRAGAVQRGCQHLFCCRKRQLPSASHSPGPGNLPRPGFFTYFLLTSSYFSGKRPNFPFSRHAARGAGRPFQLLHFTRGHFLSQGGPPPVANGLDFTGLHWTTAKLSLAC